MLTKAQLLKALEPVPDDAKIWIQTAVEHTYCMPKEIVYSTEKYTWHNGALTDVELTHNLDVTEVNIKG